MKPTSKQMRYLRYLALATGTTFTPPRTSAEASREIARLKQRPVDDMRMVVAERRQVQAAIASNPHDASRHRRSETQGYGSSARWANSHDRQGVGR